jgi:transcriptional regulator with XRE-family HTH domain
MLNTQIIERMTELHLSQAQLARKSGLSVQMVNCLVKGTRGKRMSLETERKLRKGLRVNESFFRRILCNSEKPSTND